MGKKVVIVGLPNGGKSQIFNNLTGGYSIVANYPQTTVEVKRSRCRLGGEPYEVIDTPGIHSLYIQTKEEAAVRELIFSEKPNVIIQCVDAGRLKQSLALTTDFLELAIPMVVALNGIDETTRMGMRIDAKSLSRLLRVPVVESIAVNGYGTAELIEALRMASPGNWDLRYADGVEQGVSIIQSMLPEDLEFKRKMALLLEMNDPAIAKYLEKTCADMDAASMKDKVEAIRRQFVGSISLAVSNRRSRWVDEVTAEVLHKKAAAHRELPQRIARFISRPLTGVPILLMVIFIMYFLIVNVANEISEWMELALWRPSEQWISGIFPAGFMRDLLIGEYGVLSLGVANALLTVLPILTVFYLFFNTIEDIGYIPNLSIMTRQLLEKVGLSGNAVMPLVLGFGCKTMATLTTRSLATRKERYIAIYLIAFGIPCAAQMGVNMSILGRVDLKAFIIAFAVLALAELLAGLALNKILKDGGKNGFILELPPIRLPSIGGTLKKTYYRLAWFLKEALPVFIYASLLLFVLDRIGLLNDFRLLLRPFIQGVLGLPLAMADAIILCMARREAAAGLIINLIKSGQLNYVQCVVAVVVTTMFAPCFANMMTMIKELGSKRALLMIGAINVSAVVIGGALNWTLIVFLRT